MATRSRYFDDWLTAFVAHSSHGEAPTKMLFWTGISTIAGALRRRVWIDQKYFQWIPNFYVVMVAPPGIVSKSTTANIGMNLLREVKEIKFGPDVITWQAIISSLGKGTTHDPDPRTGEFYPMSAVTFCSDELGNLLNPSDRELIDALVALWDGKRGVFAKETKTAGSDAIENPFVNVIGCTTPAWISGTFPEYMIGGGFTSRCVFIYADQKRQLVPYVDEVVPSDFDETARLLVHDLEVISMLFGEFNITQEARIWGRAWYKEHWAHPPVAVSTDQFAGYISRKQTHMHKLAMVLSASQNDSMDITAKHLEIAAAILDTIEEDMPKVFARIGQNEITRGSSQIIALVEQNPGITQQNLFLSVFRTLSQKDFTEALTGAINSGRIRQVQRNNEYGYYPVKKGDPEPTDAERALERKAN